MSRSGMTARDLDRERRRRCIGSEERGSPRRRPKVRTYLHMNAMRRSDLLWCCSEERGRNPQMNQLFSAKWSVGLSISLCWAGAFSHFTMNAWQTQILANKTNGRTKKPAKEKHTVKRELAWSKQIKSTAGARGLVSICFETAVWTLKSSSTKATLEQMKV